MRIEFGGINFAGFDRPPFARNGQGDGGAFTNRNGFANTQGNNNGFQGIGNGQFTDERHFRNGGRDGGFGGRGARSPWMEVLTNFGFMAVFIIPTYYIDKRLFRKKGHKSRIWFNFSSYVCSLK